MIPLVAPTITPRDRNALAAFAWTDRLNDEREVRRFEEAFAERVGCVGAVAVCSGTEALRLAMTATGMPYVALPSYACSAVTNAALTRHRSYLDSHFDIRTAQMSQEILPSADQLSAPVLVHMFGRVTRGYGDIEDYTLSLGAVQVLMGRVGVCSFHASKMITTCGRGGVVFSNDEALLAEVRALAYYDSTPNGTLGAHSLGMTSVQAAMGLSQLAQLDEFIERRRAIAAYYSERFDDFAIECPEPDCGSVFFRYIISTEGAIHPSKAVELLAAHGIEAGRGVYPPLHQQLGLPDGDFPGATECVNRLLSVPCHPSLSDKQVAYVAEKVLEVCA